MQSTAGPNVQAFGGPGDTPVSADYDGDGKADLATYRLSSATWFLQQSTAGPKSKQFGAPGVDVALPTPQVYRFRASPFQAGGRGYLGSS
jgi:hypothetical protein